MVNNEQDKSLFNKFLAEVIDILKNVNKYLGRRPTDNFEKMIKAIEVTVWLIITYDLVKGMFTFWR